MYVSIAIPLMRVPIFFFLLRTIVYSIHPFSFSPRALSSYVSFIPVSNRPTRSSSVQCQLMSTVLVFVTHFSQLLAGVQEARKCHGYSWRHPFENTCMRSSKSNIFLLS